MIALRDAWRTLLRSPAFAVMVVAILSIGLGLNAAIFTVVDCVLLRPLGFRDAGRIVSINTRFTDSNRVIPRIGGGDFADLTGEVHSLETSAYYNNGDSAVQVHGQPVMAHMSLVSPHFAEVMGVEAVAGRLFHSSDSKGLDALVAASFAREHFGSPAAAVGQPLHVDDSLRTIVGVLPDGFLFPGSGSEAGTQVWAEGDAAPANLNRTAFNQRAIGKLRPGVTLAQLNAELSTFSKRLARANPDDRKQSLEAESLKDRLVGPIAPTLRLLMGSVGVLLMIVCANVTHLQLVRATRGMRQVAVRSALGASRSRIAMGAVAEAALLSAAGCAGALLLAYPALRLLVHLAPASLPRLAEVQLNWHVLLYSLLVSFVLMALTALLPVWRSWHVNQSQVLRQDSARGLESRSAIRLRSGFLVVQVAFTLVLAAGAVLLAQQLIAQSREDLGFNMDHLYTLDSSAIEPVQSASAVEQHTSEAVVAQEEAASGALRLARLDRALNTLRATPGVLGAEAIDGAPLGFGGSNVSYAIHGRSEFVAGATLPNAEMKAISPGALKLLGIPLQRGRVFTSGDREGTAPVVLVSRELAHRVFPGEDPVGHQIMCGYDRVSAWQTIVGVVGSVKDTPGTGPEETIYVPIAQHATRAISMQLMVRTGPGARLSEDALRQQLSQAQPDIAATASSMAQNFAGTQRDLRFRSVLFESFAGASILLAMLGMYAATSYSVTQRTFEFGVRMALGATRRQILLGVLRAAAWVAAIGAGTGVLLFFLLTRGLAALVGKFPVNGPGVAAAAIAVVLLTLLAAALPARRTSNIDPVRALRTE